MTSLFMTLLDMTLKGSFVILTVYIIRWWLKLFDYPRRFSYLLWGIVLLRLLMPVSIASPLSRLPDRFTHSIAAEWADDYVGNTHIFHDNTDLFETAVAHGISPITDNQGNQYVVTGEDRVSPPKTVKTEVFPMLSALWLTGIGAMLLWNVLAMLRLRKQLKEAIPLEGNVFICDRIETAFVVGLLRPRIYLPSGLSDIEQAHILKHEQYHIRKHDHLWKLLGFGALCLHWFNPLVWLAYKLAMEDMELRCDEAVTADLDEDAKADYAQTLLDMTTGQRHFQIAPVAFGEGDTANRVRHVLGSRNTTKLAAVLAVCILLFTAVGMLTDPKERNYSFGASIYGYERIAYQDHNTKVGKPPYSFCLTTDNVFWALDSAYGWEELGVVDLYELTADEMLDMMPYRLAAEKPIPVARITDSKIVRFDDDNGQHLFYLLTRHKEGKHYIAYGVSDSAFYEPDKMTILTLYPVSSGIGEMSSNGPFYTRCLESMLNVGVDVFSTYHAGDGWQIVGFRTGVPKTDYGWAVFRVQNNAATFTGQMQMFENAQSINNGILLSEPAVCNETGEITDKTAYDVVLIANPAIASMQIHTDPPMDLGIQEVSVPDMVTIPWETTKDAKTVAMFFYDAEGNLVPNGEQDELRQTLYHLVSQLREDDVMSSLHHFAPGRLSYMTDIAEAYLADPIEAAKTEPPMGIRAINVYRGVHTIVQFDLPSLTDQYTGYYYSPDDVPTAFQAADVALTETDEGWTWQGEGDNHGTTQRIAECWFRYTAAF
ncbi:MAG: M56 family metallopeptidase [Oscillospiraceae bacterium]|nr:M56 family metallopeptidase [Oscillospiraceae bacterium]